MKKPFAVVLNWETETDTGYSPVLVGVHAENEDEALDIAIEQAESGKLFNKMYGEDADEMTIHRESSFACPVSDMMFIND